MTKSTSHDPDSFVAQTPFGKIRAIQRGGQTWYYAAEVCHALGHNKPREALQRIAPQDYASIHTANRRGRARGVVNATGVYQLFLLSPREYAQDFRRRIAATSAPDWYDWPNKPEADHAEAVDEAAKAAAMADLSKRLRIDTTQAA